MHTRIFTTHFGSKNCSACKVEVSAQHAQELMDAIESIHHVFWAIGDEKFLDSSKLRPSYESSTGSNIWRQYVANIPGELCLR